MSRLIDYKNKRINLITVLNATDERYSDGSVIWECVCDCGKKIKIPSNRFKTESIYSCGCIRRPYKNRANKKINEYDISGEIGVGYYYDKYFLFDKECFDEIRSYYWYLDKNGYVTTKIIKNNKITYVLFHRLIMKCKKGLVVDHINKNVFDNRKDNLRITTYSKNNAYAIIPKNNTSGIIGVYYSKKDEAWIACIGNESKTKYLGYFDNIDDAIRTRLVAEIEYFGIDFAPQVKLFEKYGIDKNGGEWHK